MCYRIRYIHDWSTRFQVVLMTIVYSGNNKWLIQAKKLSVLEKDFHELVDMTRRVKALTEAVYSTSGPS